MSLLTNEQLDEIRDRMDYGTLDLTSKLALFNHIDAQVAALGAIKAQADRWSRLAEGDRFYARRILDILEATK